MGDIFVQLFIPYVNSQVIINLKKIYLEVYFEELIYKVQHSPLLTVFWSCSTANVMLKDYLAYMSSDRSTILE